MLQLPERLRFDLADTFAGDRELLADFFERVVGVHADAEAHAQHAFFAWCDGTARMTWQSLRPMERPKFR